MTIEQFGRRVKYLRRKKKLKREDVGAYTFAYSVTKDYYRTMGRLERGELRLLTPDEIIRLCEAMKIDYNELLGELQWKQKQNN